MCTWKEFLVFWFGVKCFVYIYFVYIYYMDNLMCHLRPEFPYWFFCLDDLSINVSGVLKSHKIIVLLPVSPFMFVNICFMYLGAPVLVAYMFTIVISSSWIDHYAVSFFVSGNSLYLKSILYDMSIGIPAFFGFYLHLKLFSIPSLSVFMCL